MNKLKQIKIKVKPEGRKNIYTPEKQSLKDFIKSKKMKHIHNFVPLGMMMLGADYDVKSVLKDIDRAERLAIFTDSTANMGHSLALILRFQSLGVILPLIIWPYCFAYP